MPYSRKRSRSRSVDFSRAVKTARRTGTVAVVSKARRTRSYMKLRPLASRVNTLYRMIETKEGSQKSGVNVGLPHNNITVVQNSDGSGALNIFRTGQGSSDPMDRNSGARVGDQISVKGVMIRGFMENALDRAKVHYRVMLLRGSKGETFDRTTIFKNDADNKIIDQVNTERFTIVAQKMFTISYSNYPAAQVGASGIPTAVQSSIAMASGIATKTFKMWIPGRKFGPNGNIQYENGAAQVKFYDYRLCILAYDWYGTPQDVNNVGKINELYSKIYFKDA